MTERQRRDRVDDQRPPSRHMRSLLRQAVFGVNRLLRGFRYANRIYPRELTEMHHVLELCRRAGARDPQPEWLAPLVKAVPPGPAEAVAALNLVLQYLAALDITWRRRLTAAGIDPKWPDSGA